MGVIQVLDPLVVNKIAAGEVIDRPASIVKELVENALDAHATWIRVEVRDGGRREIRVSDDGVGLAPEDLPLAFASHATSKLRSPEDLFSVRTLGFRGEALASIGAIAEARVVSRPRGATEGAEVECRGGEVAAVRPAGCAEGTTIEVRNLFWNTPVRRRFLKSANVEYGHVQDMLTRFALSALPVRFELVREGHVEWSLPAAGDFLDRVTHAFGAEVKDGLRRLEAAAGDVKARIYIGTPAISRPTPRLQYFWVNGRYVRDRILTRAVMDATRELIPHDRFPVVFLFLDLPPMDVDVNVHPTKTEVRFRNAWQVHDLVQGAIRERMLSRDLSPAIPLPPPMPWERPSTSQQAGLARPFDAPMPPAPWDREVPSATEPTQSSLLPPAPGRFFQVLGTFIVEEAPGEIRIIDQHALHERVMYYEMKRRMEASGMPRQRLLLPAVVELGADRGPRLTEIAEALLDLGIETEPFGASTLLVRALPEAVGEIDPVALVRDLVDSWDAKERMTPDHLDRLLFRMACHAAVRAGDRLSQEEIAHLLALREEVEQAWTCPHGRPTTLRIPLEDLERHFHRR